MSTDLEEDDWRGTLPKFILAKEYIRNLKIQRFETSKGLCK